VKRPRALFGRLPGGHRPPTGPLTTEEESEAEALRHETSKEENEQKEREEEERDDPHDRPSAASSPRTRELAVQVELCSLTAMAGMHAGNGEGHGLPHQGLARRRQAGGAR
jgi:hypothetical protein